MDLQKEREALIAEIEVFKAEMLKSYVIKAWADSYVNTDPFSYVFTNDGNNEIWWMRAQTYELWHIWQEAKAQAVQEWISVQDRMPEQGQKVLVFRPDAHNHPHKDPNFKICTYAGADIFINSHFEHVITHWKPLESPIEAQEPAND